MKFLNVIFKGHSISELIQEVIYVFIGYFFPNDFLLYS